MRSKALLRQEGINCCASKASITDITVRKALVLTASFIFSRQPEGLVSNPHYKLERKGATSDDLPALVSDTQ